MRAVGIGNGFITVCYAVQWVGSKYKPGKQTELANACDKMRAGRHGMSPQLTEDHLALN
jgi:hypothetical protein